MSDHFRPGATPRPDQVTRHPGMGAPAAAQPSGPGRGPTSQPRRRGKFPLIPVIIGVVLVLLGRRDRRGLVGRAGHS